MNQIEEDVDEVVIENEYLSSPPCDPKSFHIGYRAALSAIIEGRHPGILMRANREQYIKIEKELQKEYDEYHKGKKID